MRWQHAVIWRLEQKPSTQSFFFDICVALVSVVGRVGVIATPSLRRTAPKKLVRKLPNRANDSCLTGTLRIRITLMNCSSREPVRFRDESSLLPQKPDPQCFFFDKTPAICELPSDPVTICDKNLVLTFFFFRGPSSQIARPVRFAIATKA